MNYPIWPVAAPGLLIAAVSIIHVFISHFAIGGGALLVLGEVSARRRGDTALLAFVRGLSRFFAVLTLVFGALTGVGIWFTIGLVSPQATSALLRTFLWAWAIEWTLFFTEITAALVYAYGWTRLTARTHEVVGWIYLTTAWLSLFAINGILTFMLTSGEWVTTRSLLGGFANPTFWPVLALRSAVAVGLAGLFGLLHASTVSDAGDKARIARWIAVRFVLPASFAIPVSLVWFLANAAAAGVPVAEAFGVREPWLLALLAGLFESSATGNPAVRRAAQAAIVVMPLVGLGVALLVTLRARTYRAWEAAVLLLLGGIGVGSGEWTREGLRKPYAIDRYLFVNGVRLSSGTTNDDPFALEALRTRGVLATSPWLSPPADFRPGTAEFEALPEDARREIQTLAGAEVQRALCSICHTIDGPLGLRRLAGGRSFVSLDAILARAAEPVDARGRPSDWSDPKLRLETWRGRRMPPFAGTDAERRAVAVWLSSLGQPGRPARAAAHVAAAPSPAGARVFGEYCAACHGADSPWPIRPRLRHRSEAELFDLLGRLPEVRPEMPPFGGTDEERRALAGYLATLALTGDTP